MILIKQIVGQYSRINLSNVKDNNFIDYKVNPIKFLNRKYEAFDKNKVFLFNFMCNFEGHDLIFLCFDRLNKPSDKNFSCCLN
jgi:hypothetical protein